MLATYCHDVSSLFSCFLLAQALMRVALIASVESKTTNRRIIKKLRFQILTCQLTPQIYSNYLLRQTITQQA
eukprot:scaffold2550_cov153-Skeletonema_menzelii.AAC.11